MISAIIRKFLPRNSSRFPDDENGDILEQEIEKISKPFNGKNDGWGFYGN